MIRDWFSILKPRIVALLVIVAVASALVATGGRIDAERLAILAFAGACACAGASVLNNFVDRDIDGLMSRTRNRPIPNQRLRGRHALLLGMVLVGLSGLVASRLGAIVTAFVLAGAVVYVAVYTVWLKRRSHQNIVIGGLSGSCAVLAGWFTGSSEFSQAALLIALLLFLWTPSHFWSFALVHSESYRQAGIPMLPLVRGKRCAAGNVLVYSSLVIVAALAVYFSLPLSLFYLVAASGLSAIFLASNIRLWLKPLPQIAWTNYKLSGIYLLAIFVAMVGDILV